MAITRLRAPSHGWAGVDTATGGTATKTSQQATFPAATAGNLLIVAVAVDKNAGTWGAAPSGWTTLLSQSGTSVSFAVIGKVAAGGETTATVTWGTVQGSASWLAAEYTGQSTTDPFGPLTATAYTDTNRTSLAINPPAAEAAGVGLAFLAIDSMDSQANGDTGPEFAPTSAGWSHVVTAFGRASQQGFGGVPGMALVEDTTIASGEDLAPTFTWTRSDQVAGGIVLLNEQPAPVTPPAPAKTWGWLGAVDQTTAVATLKGTNLASPRLMLSTSSAMTSPTYGPVGTVNSQSVARLTISGLTPNTTYHYRFEDSGTVLAGGSFKTLPAVGSPASFRFAFASCMKQSRGNPTALDRARAKSPLFFLFTGDFGYPDDYGTITSATHYRTNYNERLGQPAVASLTATVPSRYVYDDHDGPGIDDGHATSPGMAFSSQEYRNHVPYPASIPATTGVYHTFAAGRVRFVVLDCRAFRTAPSATDGTSKTMLGATQKSWLQDILATATEQIIFVVSSVTWVGAAAAGADDWRGYANERTQVAGWINASGKRVVILTGDMHGLAYDDGTNTGGVPVWVSAPIAAAASVKGGPYSGGTLATTGDLFHYSYVDVADSGGTVTATWTGVNSADGTWATTAASSITPPTTGGLRVGLNQVTSMKVGTQNVAAAYIGTTKVWQAP